MMVWKHGGIGNARTTDARYAQIMKKFVVHHTKGNFFGEIGEMYFYVLIVGK